MKCFSFKIPVEVISEGNDIHAPASTEDESQSQDKQVNALALKRLATLRDLLEEILPERSSHEGQFNLYLVC